MPEPMGSPAARRASLTATDLVDMFVMERVRQHVVIANTARNELSMLRGFARVCGGRAVSKLSKRDVERWLESIAHLAPATRRTRFSTILIFGDWLAERRYLRANPVRTVKAPKVPRTTPRALTPEAVGSTLAHVPDMRARLIVVLMAQLGLRRAEVAGLELDDLDFRYLTVRVTGKGGHERILPLTAEAVETLRAYLAELQLTRGPVIRSYTRPERGLSPGEVGRIVTRAMTEAGVKQYTGDGRSAHALRHTAATDMLRGGAHVRTVQAALGHAHLVTTERYLPAVVGDLRESMEGRRYRGAHLVPVAEVAP